MSKSSGRRIPMIKNEFYQIMVGNISGKTFGYIRITQEDKIKQKAGICANQIWWNVTYAGVFPNIQEFDEYAIKSKLREEFR